jgi:sugar-specific transcriptional regulator TrmB|tara:strand:- start:162 stop:920 length:759 start_codon:yes stop_codon:yes gene_type:complete
MDLSTITDIGLTEGESKVYLALLELGSSTSGPIIDKSGVAKSIIYQLLEKLIQKGLVSYIIKEKTKHYQAAEPNKLIDYVDKRAKILQDNKLKLEQALPELLLKQKEAKPSEVTVFEGYKGMITVHEHTYSRLKRGGEYFFLGIPPEQPKHFHAYWKRDHIRRSKTGIKCRLLFHSKTSPDILKNRNKFDNCDARYMPLDMETPAWFMGYSNVSVIGFPSSNPITIEIINQEIADSFKAYFDSFWKNSQPYK